MATRLIILMICLMLLLPGCEDNSTSPESGTGSLMISSVPHGAEIYMDGTDTRRITPTVFRNIDTGTVTITLKNGGYKDTTFLQRVLPIYLTTAYITLTPASPYPDTIRFHGIKLYEHAYNNLDGLDLSTGELVYVDDPSADIYFDGGSGPRDLRSQHLGGEFLTNTTLFRNTAETNLSDGEDSEFYEESTFAWIFHNNNNSGYSFLFDRQKHYSKLRIVGLGSDGPARRYIIIDYIYNRNPNDPRF